MKAFQVSLLLTLVPSIYGQGCTQDQDTFCEEQANKICALKSDGNPECAGCVANAVAFQSGCIPLDEIELFAYLEEFQVDYRTSISREERWALLRQSLQLISEHQARNPDRTYELGLTPASADNEQDLLHRSGLLPDLAASETATSAAFQAFSFNASNPIPSAVNWVNDGAVTPPKDQGRCAASWAIATAGAIEGAAAVSTGLLQSLSHQQFISCDSINLGCEGGDLVTAAAYAFEYEDRNPTGGIVSLATYPYTDSEGVATTGCAAPRRDIAVEVTSGKIVIPYNSLLSLEKRMENMKQQLSIQPVAVAIKSACPTFANYKSGILTTDGDCFCADSFCFDHAVLLVGYNDEDPIPYWIIKNSWSTDWGEGGYARIAQTDTGTAYGLFGIMTHGVVPEVPFAIRDQSVEPAVEDDDFEFEWWHIFLITVGAVLVLCCLFWTCANLLAPSPEHHKQEQ
ncbi:unnamed protein product [Cylindrotheca closterium]|uniref:Peptidase C1A papain C-terminal domain-containing protein n=1 Tax=Cylindrotheca closterium TaxID=2856 RepID=A0AAD2FGQ8_9STRA|nr:unnamed protein product [Cylindrotheca closterium]